MSNVKVIADLHLGHRRIVRFRTPKHCHLHYDADDPGWTYERYADHIFKSWENSVRKNDTVYVLGDVFWRRGREWEEADWERFKCLPGRKLLVRGNHDNLTTEEYLDAFEEVHGIIKYKGAWLTHCPIHPDELRGSINIHGHVHSNSIADERYFNACVEHIGPEPVDLIKIINSMKK